jgi:UbiD family decarboxylase
MGSDKDQKFDSEKFRLRRFVERLEEMDELEIHDEPVALADLSPIIEASPKAVLFRKAGPEGLELVANVSGSRRRVAAAFGVAEEELPAELARRMANPQPIQYVDSDAAPVHDIVLKGDDADLTRLPFHPQHEFDGSTYISSAIDYAVDPDTGVTNVGCRRLSLRNRRECGTNVTAPSDLRGIYRGCVARGERLPINFAVGGHPVDYMAAGIRIPVPDEFATVATLRGEPLPLVKGITNDVPVPADAELVIEGYLEEKGYVEPEGPYGEYAGYYGPMHFDPVFKVTAITMRKDALHQSLLHGHGRSMHRVESATLGAIRVEMNALRVLKNAGIQATAVHVPAGSAESWHLRVALKQTRHGIARNAINLLFGAILPLKHIYVVDEDVDIFDDRAMEWAMATRFQADRDIVLVSGLMGMPMDPSLEHGPTGAKAGFDLTLPHFSKGTLLGTVAEAKRFTGSARHQTVEAAIAKEALYFSGVMEAVGSRDGREVALALDELRAAGKLMRDDRGRYLLGSAPQGTTGLTEDALDHLSHDPNAFT